MSVVEKVSEIDLKTLASIPEEGTYGLPATIGWPFYY